MPDPAPKTLKEAADRFSAFLSQNGLPARVIWTGRGDLLWGKSRLWIRDYPDGRSWEAACKRYSRGLELYSGVCLEAFASTKDAVVARVFIPMDEDVMERSLTPKGSLKLAAAIAGVEAQPITNGLAWTVLSVWFRKSTRSFLDSFEMFAEA